MIIYENTKTGFINDVNSGLYVQKIESMVFDKMHRKTSPSEINSWMNSLIRMKDVIDDNDIPEDVGVAIEYNIPTTSKRVDFILSGYNKNKEMETLFVELKQWQEVTEVKNQEDVVKTYTGNGNRIVAHPSYQVWSYTELLKNSNKNIQLNNIKLNPCAYLHNYNIKNNDPIIDSKFDNIIERAPIFTITDRDKLKQYIKKHIKYGDKLLSLEMIEKSELYPAKSLQDSIFSMLKKNPEFIMIDEQKVIYEQILNFTKQSKLDNKKRVIIVKGGPGTGKTVVAINLLVKIINMGIFSSYVTKNSAPREVFYQKLKGKDFKTKYIKGLFLGSGSFINTPKDSYGLLICDEAHRLNEKSGMYQNLGDNQIKEIIEASKTSVFFIDENQRVTSKDIGSITEIKKWADTLNAECFETELTSQFRCGGSDGYLSWIDNTLQIKETANISLEGVTYDFRVFDSPNELKQAIINKNKIKNKSRLVAGYCWNWISKKNPSENINDIVIDDFEMQWNLSQSKLPFAIDDTSVNQIGCIHTCQGLEFDYVGVIIGDDLRYENGEVITDYTKKAKSDISLKGLKGLAKKKNPEALNKIDLIIRNTYRTLMTRGLKGCYIYCTDKNLSNYFEKCITQEIIGK
ncbi:MAG: DNA/RNA helicase domain-containing protein [Pleomorphochaeta sp.]